MAGVLNRLRAGSAARIASLALAVVTLAGCANQGGLSGFLRSRGVGGGPDEFLVLPTAPLELPENLAALPPPTPGVANRVDPNPEAEAVAALTGRPGPAGTVGAGALVAQAGPVSPAIRTQLAAEDAEFRSGNRGRLLERWSARDSDYVTYQGQRLDADSEFIRLRAAGLRVPAAPPPGIAE
jgi:hypothetical protein